jgi:hypothetical protein
MFHDGPRDGHSLLFASAQIGGQEIQPLAQADLGQYPFGGFSSGLAL